MKNARWIKVMALLLAILMILPMALACKKEEESVGETETTEGTVILPLTLIENGKSDYAIVRSSTASQAEISAATMLRDTIYQICGIRLKLLNELDVKNEKAICVGRVSRDSVNSLMIDVEYTDYVIGVSDTDLVICGGCDEKTTEAVERFISEYLSEKTKTLTVAGDLKILSINTNKKTVKVGDLKLSGYAIIVPQAASSVDALTEKVNFIHNYCLENFGFGFEMKDSTTKATGKEIIIGETNRKKSASVQAELDECGLDYGTIYFDDGNIWITGNAMYAVLEALDTFIEDYIAAIEENGDVFVMSTDNKRANCSGPEYTLMSFNILFDNDDGTWRPPNVRKNAILYQINYTYPDVLGVQECTAWWYDTLNAALLNRYAVVGEINDPSGQCWRNAVYYRKDKFDLVETGTKWLSNTPDVKSWLSDGSQYRIMTYVVLRDKTTGDVFTVCNTHLGFGAKDRPAQDDILMRLANGLGDRFNCPVAIMGDFNRGDYVYLTGRTEKQMMEHYAANGFIRSYYMTNVCDPRDTLDYVFVTVDSINVVSHDILEEWVNGVDPSDHNATVVKIRLKK